MAHPGIKQADSADLAACVGPGDTCMRSILARSQFRLLKFTHATHSCQNPKALPKTSAAVMAALCSWNPRDNLWDPGVTTSIDAARSLTLHGRHMCVKGLCEKPPRTCSQCRVV
jgi:hypothetical protein